MGGHDYTLFTCPPRPGFLPCWSDTEAQLIANMLNSKPAQEFFESMIFWADKRPITVEILKRLDLHALSTELGCEEEFLRYARRRQEFACKQQNRQQAFDWFKLPALGPQ